MINTYAVWIKVYEDGKDKGEWHELAEFTNREDAEKLFKAQDLNGDGESAKITEEVIFESAKEFMEYGREHDGIKMRMLSEEMEVM